MNFRNILSITCTLYVLVSPNNVFAQAVTIFGGGADAQECFFSAQIAAQMQTASRDELEPCNRALELVGSGLSLRDLAATLINRGIIYAALEDYKKASSDYTRAKSVYPDFGAIYVNRGNLFFMAELYSQAIDEYTTALGKQLAQNHIAHLNRGMAYEKLGQFASAENDYRQAIEIAPEWYLAQAKLQRVLNKISSQE